MSTSDDIAAMVTRIRTMPLSEPPLPWRETAVHAVGGLTAVGFFESSELLLVCSHNGRGVFDCATGERIARDPDAPGDWLSERGLAAQGIGPLAGRVIRLAGPFGGGLPTVTADGWAVEVVWPDWPDGSLILSPLGESVLVPRCNSRCVKIRAVEELRAFGFSGSGCSLVVAESHTLTIFGREAA